MKTTENVYVKGSAEAMKLRKQLQKEGWVSGHYLTRHGHSPDQLRKMAKAGQLSAKILCNLGTTTYWYNAAEVAQLKPMA
ncbi:hypothetical protein SAMN02799624_05397 [Paenibacillus sp. UNC496MF]|uniref:hypothetical protein n=1 Tax=Paenibacillus sp. UNC496MF TaxID=1502753 RepID=UPI0008E51ADE|nr:hypothetical protein [Paenibacillus sp. UNC496MF]SFJ65420.1 hypothetical protein SAMN02799624_05397 [Paenibacillus sp. UNC496MF]